MSERKPDGERKRNALSIRWNDYLMGVISDVSWRRRTNCSEFVRDAVKEKMQREGIETEQQIIN